jgi:hypothetical protein
MYLYECAVEQEEEGRSRISAKSRNNVQVTNNWLKKMTKWSQPITTITLIFSQASRASLHQVGTM